MTVPGANLLFGRLSKKNQPTIIWRNCEMEKTFRLKILRFLEHFQARSIQKAERTAADDQDDARQHHRQAHEILENHGR